MTDTTADRKLLEDAARAAGIAVHWGNLPHQRDMLFRDDGGEFAPEWNPLIDSGDALELAIAVSVRMDTGLLIMPPDKFDPWAIVRDWGATIDGGKADRTASDNFAATRLAIVRCCAALGGAK